MFNFRESILGKNPQMVLPNFFIIQFFLTSWFFENISFVAQAVKILKFRWPINRLPTWLSQILSGIVFLLYVPVSTLKFWFVLIKLEKILNFWDPIAAQVYWPPQTNWPLTKCPLKKLTSKAIDQLIARGVSCLRFSRWQQKVAQALIALRIKDDH